MFKNNNSTEVRSMRRRILKFSNSGPKKFMIIHGQSLVIHVQKQKIYGGEEYEEELFENYTDYGFI